MTREVTRAEAVWDEGCLEVTLHDKEGFVIYGVYIWPEKNKALVSHLKEDGKYWSATTLYEGEIEEVIND